MSAREPAHLSKPMTQNQPTFMSLMAEHAALRELFLSHQDALLARDLELARSRLFEFQARLLAHMRDEEAELIPLYRERAGQIPGGSPDYFLLEHKKLRELLSGLIETLKPVDSCAARDPRGLVVLFDQEFMFKSLLEHHDLREGNILYPTLDRLTDVEERSRLLGGGHAASSG